MFYNIEFKNCSANLCSLIKLSVKIVHKFKCCNNIEFETC